MTGTERTRGRGDVASDFQETLSDVYASAAELKSLEREERDVTLLLCQHYFTDAVFCRRSRPRRLRNT